MKARFQTPDYHTSSALNRRMKTIGLRSSSKKGATERKRDATRKRNATRKKSSKLH